MGNFYEAVKDAKRARAFHYCYRGVRAFQKSPIQAIVTGAKACKELQLYEEAIKWCCDGLAKIDRENKTLQEVKGKSIKDEAKYDDAQKLNTKTETDAVKEINDRKGSLSSKIIGECRGISRGARNDFDRAQLYLVLPTSSIKKNKDRAVEGIVHVADGFQLFASGEKEKAISRFNQGLAVFRELGDRKGEESVGVILAAVYQSLSWECHFAHDYHHAEENFKRRVVIMKETRLAAAQNERIGEPHFNLYQVGRNFKKAEEYYSEDLADCKKMGDRPGEALAYRNLGDTCYLTALDEVHCSNYMRDAMSHYNEYLNISVELGDKGKEGDAYLSIGRIHQYLGDLKKTKQCYNKCLTICKEIRDVEGGKHALRKLRSTLLIRGDLKQVMQLNNQSLFISKKSHDHFHEAEALIYQGHCLAECRFFSDAVLSYQSSVEKANSIRDWNLLEDWMKISIRHFFGIAYAALSATLLRLDKTEEALLTAEKGRAQALADLLETQYGFEACHHGQDSSEVSQRETASELFTCAPANTVFLAVSKNVINVWLLQDGKQVHFSQSNLTEDHSEDPSSMLEETYKEVGVKRRVRCEDRSLDALRNKDGLTIQKPTDLSLLSFQESLRNGNRKAPRTSPPVHRKRLSVLYDAVVAPVIPHLRGNELVIVPDGQFFLVPFGALQDTESRYLCESFSIRVIPSLTCLKMILDAPTEHHCKRGALVVGDPWVQEVVDDEGRKLRQLPSARKEAKMIAAIVKTSPLIGSDATKEAVLSRLNNVALIHLAAHGNSKAGEIVLAPNLSRKSKIPTKEDFLLTMPDVLSVGLRARLVVLSCCHSGQGEVFDEGVVGIARAFLGAGARSVLVALWAIDDDATLEFMRVFYKHLARGMKASQALNGATNYMRESSHMRETKDFGATCHWAPFVLLGDDVTLDCFEENEDVSEHTSTRKDN
ncbi:tetratricopeptide repeat protein 28-like isoform X3 [Orbicella faveolata]|uniref:tetratricopeptide repeat protein 28-like isoform X3 n=1 Tax=Orbicella faveolata TaxID=48498 RepID=UPI0009E32958|nr:tetratricopeptide repeat protein 28-like isoform X3 [Orbicella faveolata]